MRVVRAHVTPDTEDATEPPGGRSQKHGCRYFCWKGEKQSSNTSPHLETSNGSVAKENLTSTHEAAGIKAMQQSHRNHGRFELRGAPAQTAGLVPVNKTCALSSVLHPSSYYKET